MSAMRDKRTTARLTLEEVANRFGVCAASVSLWETGKRLPRLDMAFRLAAFYGCSIEHLWPELVPKEDES